LWGCIGCRYELRSAICSTELFTVRVVSKTSAVLLRR
jgi:hypothetical protein